MTIFVLTKAMSQADDWTDIHDTQVFKTIDEARKAMLDEVNMHINGPDEKWSQDWGKEPKPASIHLSRSVHDEEAVWAISRHEI